MSPIPKKIKKLLDLRQKMRESGQFSKADALRNKIQKMGYILADSKNQTKVYPVKKDISPKQSFLVLFGSGETSSTAIKIHDYVFKRMAKKEIQIVIVSTPAGFQPNVKIVYEEIAQFFKRRLQNYHPRVQIIYANTFSQANDPKIIKSLDTADYIFTGPGSPTYTVKHLKNSHLYKKIVERVKKGATLSLASAATIAFSHFTLPVYEIYKVGQPLHWVKGLDFYYLFFKRLTVIPHFNNREGGKKNDTARCFMGKKRFQSLLKWLPKKEKIWGIDEHTAIVINLKAKKPIALGKGKLHFV